MIISFVFAESNDLLDPYYTPEGLDRDVIYFDGVPYDLFAKLISSKEIDPEDQIANSIFTHSCFLNDLKNYATRITFNGLRVIDRSDARVSIEGFTIKDLTDDEMNELENTYGNADEFILNRKNRTLHTWWD